MRAAIGLTLAFASLACSSGRTTRAGVEPEPTRGAGPAPAPTIDAALPVTPPGAAPPYVLGATEHAGSVVGTVTLAAPLAARPGSTACGTPLAPPAARHHAGFVAGTLVSLDDIRAGAAPPDARPVDTALAGCRFEPSLALLGRLGAELAIHNRDPIRHEVVLDWVGPDGVAPAERLASIPMPLEGQRFTVAIERPGFVRLSCALHADELGWAFAPPHPYHAVTGADGRFELEGVPPGRYHVVARLPVEAGAAPLRAEASVEVQADLPAEVSLELPGL